MKKTLLPYALLVGSLVLGGCAGNKKNTKNYSEIDCGHGWKYLVQEGAMPSLQRILYLNDEPSVSEDEKARRSLNRFLLIDENGDKKITLKEAEKHEKEETKIYMEKLQNKKESEPAIKLQDILGRK